MRVALGLVAEGSTTARSHAGSACPRTTVRDWRNPRYVPQPDRGRGTCPRCWRPTPRIAFSDADYAELLGLYLGDGHITALARTEQLRISLDAKYPNVNDEIDALLRRCFPDNRVGRVLLDGGSTVVLHVYSRHLWRACSRRPDPARSTRAPIALEPWQAERVAAAPVGVPARLHPLGRLRVREPDRAVRVPDVRLLQPLRRTFASSSSMRAEPRPGVSAGWEPRAHQQACERGADARACRRQVLSCLQHANLGLQAAVVKLVYTQASGVCGLTPVEVRVLSAAYRWRVASLVSGSPAAIV